MLNPDFARRIGQAITGGTFLPNEIVNDWLSPAANRDSTRDMPFMGFTPREVEVLPRLKEGKFNKTIAYELNIAESTVKIHVRHIMRKLNALNRTQVVYLLPRHLHPDRKNRKPYNTGRL